MEKREVTHGAPWWLRRVGTAIAVCSLVYVAVRFLEYRAELAVALVPRAVWLAVPALALLHAAAGVLLACAWRDLLATNGQRPGLRWSVSIYGLSQLAKYIPGNVFHFVSRQARGAADGLPHGVLGRSSLCELLSLAAAGAIIGLWALPLIDGRLGWLSTPHAGAAVVVLGLLAARVTVGARMARVLGAHLLILLSGAVVFLWLLSLLDALPDPAAWLPFCGAYTIAWLAGFATPGAPAGLGVRELVLLFLLRGDVQDEELLLAVTLARVISVLGDTLFFCAAAWAASGLSLKKALP